MGSIIALAETDGQTVRLSPALMQPTASDDVAAAMADVTLGVPVNGIVEIASPERLPLAELAQRFLSAKQDKRKVITDIHSRYSGAELNDQSLIPGDNARIGRTSFKAWLQSNPQK